MVVILPESHYGAWLSAPAGLTWDFLRPYPADGPVAVDLNKLSSKVAAVQRLVGKS